MGQAALQQPLKKAIELTTEEEACATTMNEYNGLVESVSIELDASTDSLQLALKEEKNAKELKEKEFKITLIQATGNAHWQGETNDIAAVHTFLLMQKDSEEITSKVLAMW